MLGITEVIENLYISGLESRQTILNKGIRFVINISSECPVQDLGPSVEYEKVSLLDLPTTSIEPYFDRLTDRIHHNLQHSKKTLVHCYVGRSRSATIILAYLMKYKQMSLREAFHHLRARRHIVGPNFGFIKQLINYERSLFGYTSVTFVNTSFGSVPDIYLSTSINRPRRQISTMNIPIQAPTINTNQRSASPVPLRSSTVTTNIVNPSSPVRSSAYYSPSPNLTMTRPQATSLTRASTSALIPRATTTISNYASAYNPGATQKISRPVTSSFNYQNPTVPTVSTTTTGKSTVRQSSDLARAHSSLVRPSDLNREYIANPSKVNLFRTVKYIPSSYNRYHLP